MNNLFLVSFRFKTGDLEYTEQRIVLADDLDHSYDKFQEWFRQNFPQSELLHYISHPTIAFVNYRVKPEPEGYLKRGVGNYINCTDYDDAIEAMKKYAKDYHESEIRKTPHLDISVSVNQTFEDIVKPVMRWLKENHHPHMRIHLDSSVAELLEGQSVSLLQPSANTDGKTNKGELLYVKNSNP